MNQNTAAARSTEGALIASNRVEGTKVLDRAGKDIGTIKSLKIDKISGRVAYAVAEFGGLLGIGTHEYTIPWGKLNYDPGKRSFSTDLTKQQLEGAPRSSRRSRDNSYHASMGGVGTGRRPESDTTNAEVAARGVDSDFDDNDDNWNRGQDREVYDYYAVAYYWED